MMVFAPGRLQALAGLVAIALLAACSTHSRPDRRAAWQRPSNVVIIFTDDLGYADLGVYGADGYETPNLDRMAREGMRFTSFYVANSACTPSRAALLTGSYADRVGLPEVIDHSGTIGINAEELTLAELLKGRGYATAAVGKWHLGHYPAFLPTNHGFDSFFGVPYSNDMSPDSSNNPRPFAWEYYPPLPLLRDTTVIEHEPDQSTLTRHYTDEAVGFIEAHVGQPFFLYLAHSFPHVPLYASDRFQGTTERGLYGDVVREIDWSVGEVMTTLERLGLDEHTLVFFTSDNGPWLEFGNHSGSAGPFREGKGTTFEGGHRVPAIAWWPGNIPAGVVSDVMVTAMDLLPTAARLAGADLPEDRIIDGHDIWSILSGRPGVGSPYDHFFFYRSGELQAVRSGNWKLHVPHRYRTLDGGEAGQDGMPGRYNHKEIGLSLYDLEADPGEATDVAGEHPRVVEQLLKLIEEGRSDIGDRLTEHTGVNARPPGRVTVATHAH